MKLILSLILLFLPIVHGGYSLDISGQARWETYEFRDAGGVSNRLFALAEPLSMDPPFFCIDSKSPRTWSDSEGRFRFADVEPNRYSLALWTFRGWVLLMDLEKQDDYVIVVENEPVDVGIVRVPLMYKEEYK